ncbi:RrF2 family transcriptional regulator [Thermodesulfatator autotrophicus]|uniref:Rrf2 family transcriptional regulator n=1 Tax=Thermodesulfatator autotrophicus TaxID=1795632 RepID=A0A177E7E6_9BACT|nr:Rrf2 family transcriptional regulator [Thermodesulfatator autotrophicus]OAG27815.1 hypothetical protein TH606_05090 [Thermodesulfatator autotrophicus]
MAGPILRISDALALGLHAMAYLSLEPKKAKRVKEIAVKLNASEAHLSKVLQALARAGLLKATRGPKGGYMLNKKPEEISLIDIYEVISGPLEDQRCLFKKPLCDGKNCILGDLLRSVNHLVREHFSKTTLKDTQKIKFKEANDA